jgi:hypothetical protein
MVLSLPHDPFSGHVAAVAIASYPVLGPSREDWERARLEHFDLDTTPVPQQASVEPKRKRAPRGRRRGKPTAAELDTALGKLT